MIPKYKEFEEERISGIRTHSEKRWHQRYELLLSFIAQHHRLPRSSDKYKGFSLGHWCNKQIHYSKSANYPTERKEKLQAVGVLENSQDAKWSRRLTLFQEFTTKFNRIPRCNEEYKNENLGYWYRSTMKSIENGTISACRKEKLEDVAMYFGF